MILKTYAFKKSKIDVIFYEISLHDQEYCLSWRDAKGHQGWLGWRDSFEECEAMLPDGTKEVQ